MVIEKTDKEEKFRLLIEERQQQINHLHVDQALYELNFDWKQTEVEAIKANIKYFRYKIDTDDLCTFLFTLSSNSR